MADFSQVLVAHSVLLFTSLQVLFDRFLPDDVDRCDVRVLPAEFGLSLGLVLMVALILYCRQRKIKAKLPTVYTTTVHAVGISFTKHPKGAFVHPRGEENVLIPSVTFPCRDACNSLEDAIAPGSTGHHWKKTRPHITKL
uniref:Uncharacterized protein n=1 Tax=Branchiostoma floridae TaxID=7739 RepID=C3ZVW1_BRAFL|eukprot:XP_002587311.1 hypothetical protein BRAFLDRAFT_100976 [Branchiostoma floridae]